MGSIQSPFPNQSPFLNQSPSLVQTLSGDVAGSIFGQCAECRGSGLGAAGWGLGIGGRAGGELLDAMRRFAQMAVAGIEALSSWFKKSANGRDK